MHLIPTGHFATFISTLRYLKCISSRAIVIACHHQLYMQSAAIDGRAIHELVYACTDEWAGVCKQCSFVRENVAVCEISVLIDLMENLPSDTKHVILSCAGKNILTITSPNSETNDLPCCKEGVKYYDMSISQTKVSSDKNSFSFKIPVSEFAHIRKECAIFGPQMRINANGANISMVSVGPNGRYTVECVDCCVDNPPPNRKSSISIDTYLMILCLSIVLGKDIIISCCPSSFARTTIFLTNSVIHSTIKLSK